MIFSNKIADLQATVESVTVERDQAIEKIASLTATHAESLAAVNAQLSDLRAQHALEIASLNSTHADAIENAVIARLAEAGTDPIARDPAAIEGSDNKPASYTSQFNAIADKDERFAFYLKHKTQILAGL